MRPLGTLQTVVNALESYECDEIAIIRPVRATDSVSGFEMDLAVISSLNTSTPISFGGGIRSVEMLYKLSNLPIERLILSTAFLEQNIELLDKAVHLMGRQAIQCLLPMSFNDDIAKVCHLSSASLIDIANIDMDLISTFANEIIIYDTDNEGGYSGFRTQLMTQLPFESSRIIVSGGISQASIKWALEQQYAAVLVENKVLHREYSRKAHNYG
nr:HisA/HisF-related TIM barrel protein [Shewanella goraebulensis]